MRTFSIVNVVAIACAVAACGRETSTGPSLLPPAPPPLPSVTILVFKDPLTGLSTSDVNEAQEQVVRLNSAGELIWWPTERPTSRR